MELKEVYNKKKNKTLVFCDFEELLKEAFGVSTMKEVEAKASTQDEYIIHCPFCKKQGHKKHKLYIKTDLTVGHCFVCSRDYVNIDSEISTKVPVYKGLAPLQSSKVDLVKLTDPNWTLDMYEYDFDDEDEVGLNYLRSRHEFMEDAYKALDFKFMDGNVVMPFKYHGEVFYYQIRFSGNSKIRYFFPPISAKPPYIIEHGLNKKFIVCEGIYDAIACLIMAPEYTPMAVMGSSISDYQLSFLREYLPEEIVVYMDETDISKRIAARLKTVLDYCTSIHIIKSGGEDPEECMKRRLKQGRELQWITPDIFRKNDQWKFPDVNYYKK